MIWIFIGIIMTGCILSTGYYCIRMNDYKILYEHELSRTRKLSNMITYYKECKVDSGEWKDLTSAEIVKLVVEKMFEDGKLDVKAFLMDGKIREARRNSVLVHYNKMDYYSSPEFY